MGLFELFFPQWAAAENTREISSQLRAQQFRHSFELSKTELQERQIKELQDEISSLYLVNYSLIELLQEKKIINTDEMNQKINEIDLRDGKKDGKVGSV